MSVTRICMTAVMGGIIVASATLVQGQDAAPAAPATAAQPAAREIVRPRPHAIPARRVIPPPPTRPSCRTAPYRRSMRMATSSLVPHILRRRK